MKWLVVDIKQGVCEMEWSPAPGATTFHKQKD